MYYLKNRYFHRWAQKQGITDKILLEAIHEFKNGLFEASLGNYLYKKRVALAGRGKSSGARTIVFYQEGKKLIFCFAFEKNRQSNLTSVDMKLLKKLSDMYQKSTEEEILADIQYGDLVNIRNMEDK
ncbi:MAG: type II toxin-antitoxin system RelE/ParE family toxin [Candidatus Omnitrophica bacterium]|nr:type II toxin-antitoxin system RelE/ParE family toxin [Candidatus Omnitrophota bacterium]